MKNIKYVPRAGVAVLVIKNNKILLGLRSDDAEKADSELHGEGLWCIPGGKLDFQEKLFDGAKRELKEEADLDAKKLKIINVGNEVVHDAHFVTTGFLCKDFEGEPKVMEPDEIVGWQWFPINQLPKNIFKPSYKIILSYIKNKMIIEDHEMNENKAAS